MERSERICRIKEWEQTEEYESQYAQYQAAMDCIVSTAEGYKSILLCDVAEFEKRAVRTEVASNGDLHRGYYCPSLTYDLVVGGVKRGKPLQRFTKKSKTYFLYGFDKDDKLIWCKHFFNNFHITTEYLFYKGEHVYGLTIRTDGGLEAIAEEQYCDEKLVSYSYILVLPNNICSECVEMRKEVYSYDEQGLCTCDWYTLFPLLHDLRHERITFNRINGLLTEHYWETIIGVEKEQVVRKSGLYNSLVERKA